MAQVTIVIPCYNEAARFQPAEAERLLENPGIKLILVNDGSTDNTAAVLQRFAEQHGARVTSLDLAQNQGKAEAVRRGLQLAMSEGAEVTGYLDADFATPASEMLRLLSRQEATNAQVVLGARWLHLGAEIQRNSWRHYGGRVFATLASQVLGLKVYDTQCGAKLFRVTPLLEAALEDQFASPWAFDVELLGRLAQGYAVSDFLEVPLQQWVDVAGSKITLPDMIRATLSLGQIHRSLKSSDYSNFRGVHHGKNSGIS
jgi:glycosyltransferase involved in cell wall biosynthesis